MNLEGLTEKRRGKKSLWYENSLEEIVAKRCGKCEEVKGLSEFSSHKTGLGGVQPSCKSCEADRSRNRYKSDPNKHRERTKKWQRENAQRVLEVNKRYREDNKDRIAEYNLVYRTENKEKKAEIARAYYDKNRQQIIDNSRKWLENNPEKALLKRQRRRARERALLDDFSEEQLNITIDYFEGCSLTGSAEIHWDHVIPLSIGRVGTTYGNMVPLRIDLNLSKQNSNLFEWFEVNRQRFNLEQERFDRLIDWLASANAMSVEEYRAYVYECHANPNTIDADEAI